MAGNVKVFTSIGVEYCVAEDIAMKIFNVIMELQGSKDPEVFVKKLLRDCLNWPIEINPEDEFNFDDLGYDWNLELEAMGLRSEDRIQDLFQIAKFPGWPMGMFVVRFGSNSIFTKGRGMTMPLRNLLRNLVEKKRATASHTTWSQDQLLFMCHHEHTHYEFVRFTNMGEKTLPKLQSFGWGPNDGDAIRTLCTENLPHLLYDQSIGEEVNLQNIVKAFDIQKVSRKFYSDYKQSFNDFKKGLLNHAERDDDDEIHRYVQLVFNRFLFLRFIEKKGWLRFGPDGNFLHNLYVSFVANDNKFYKDGFLPMALEGLVEQGKQISDIYGEVELIGGGLFEESKFDSVFSDLPNGLFAPIIGKEGLLYSYNFTVQESTPFDKQVAIDPEMIGTMFEELVTNRGGKGAFYTPREVVSYMCKEGLKSTLEDKTDVDKEKITALIDFEATESISIHEATKIREALDGIKAIDPACGSGAYLLGLLQEIIKIHENLQTLSSEFNRSKYDLKLHIISRSIFGVDLDPFATQIAMVRLWLSLAVESEEPVQLPNLDFNIETGDALLAPDPSQVDWIMGSLYEQADRLAEKKEVYLSATSGIEALRKEIKEEEAEIRFNLRQQRNFPDSVDFRIHFAGVFSKNGGFDLVLANPPYVRQEDIKPADYKNNLFESYKGGSIIQPVEKKSDLYCYFYIRAMQLLRKDGVQIFICSNTWLDVGFGIPFQEYILSKHSVNSILSSEFDRQFSTAAVNTVISIMTKSEPQPDSEIKFITLLESFESSTQNLSEQKTRERVYNQIEFLNSGKTEGKGYTGHKLSIYCNAPDKFFWLLDQGFMVPLSGLAVVRRGITSGINQFFYIERSKALELGIEQEYLKPLLKSPSECKSYCIDTKNSNFMVFLCNEGKGRLASTNALKYIEWGESQVTKGRQKQKQGVKWHETASVSGRSNWYGIQSKPYADFFCNRFFHDKYFYVFGENLVDDQTFYGGKFNSNVENKILQIALLNSSIGQFMSSLCGRTGLGEGVLQYAVYEMENLPVIDSRKIPTEFAEKICKEFLQFSSQDLVKADELSANDAFKRFDNLIYKSLNLSNEVRDLILSHVASITQKRISKAQNF